MPYTRDKLYITALPADAQSDNPQQKMSKLDDDGRDFEVIRGDVLKYFSVGGEGHNFNCQLRDAYRNEIACRQLTRFLMTEPRAIKGYHEKLGSLSSIAKIKALTSGELDKANYDKHTSFEMLPPDSIGRSLAEIGETLHANEEARMVCLSDGHMMGITVAKKKTYSGGEQYVVKFYDPNITDAHMRFICPSLESLSKLSTEDLQSDPDKMALYWTQLKTVALYSPHYRDEAKELIVREGVPDEDVLFYSVSQNIAELTAAATSRICKAKGERNILLFTKALGMALQKNSREAIQAYTDAVLKAEMSSAEKTDMLLAISNDPEDEKFSSLVIAIKQEKFDVVKDYVMNILNSTLQPDHKVQLLNCGNARSNILHASIAQDREAMVHFIMDAILSSDLPPQHKVDTLVARSQTRGTALYAKMLKGEDKYVSLITDKVLASDLDPKSKVEVLLGRSQKGEPVGLIEYSARGLADQFMTKLEAAGLLDEYQAVLTEQLESPLKEEAIQIIQKYKQDVAEVARHDDIEHDQVATSSPPRFD